MLIRRIALLAACLGLVAGAVGCSTSGQSSSGNGVPAGAGSIQLIDASDRKPAPALSGDLLGGGTADLSSQAGKVVVLNIWASWCGPCRKESAGLAQAADALPNVAFIGINTRDDQSSAEAFVRAQKVPYPSFSNQSGSLLLELQRVVPVSAMPETIILDKQHRVAAAIFGGTTAITVTEIVKPLEREA